ncbi:MAG: molybdopterin molybdotransferase MoeA [Deltaproteobacteria bacterium]|nr:molybdopterin molybdotransferase MoeA [Deltaproteobacteria bacterium]
MKTFFKVKSTHDIYKSLSDIKPLGVERVHIINSLHRVIATDIMAQEDLPGFNRSTVDGYALNARDTFGASEGLPTPLYVVGEVKMGESPDFVIKKGECCLMPTGGMLPEGADSVIMVEYSQVLEDGMVEITRPVSPLENVIQSDDDLKKGEIVIKKGSLLRAQDLGVLAGLGIIEVDVFIRPKAAIISTGEELVYIGEKPKPGQVRDINSYTIGALCSSLGVQPIYLGIIRDEFEDLKALIEKGLTKGDVVFLSGGSSVGIKDITLEVFKSFEGMEILAHGVSISPGKPTIIARRGNKTLWGLPGHPASAMIIFHVLVKYLLGKLTGLSTVDKFGGRYIEAEIGRNIDSKSGRDDYIRVKCSWSDGKWVATPILGESGLISTMVEADGIIKIDMNTEGIYEGEIVKVLLF